MPNQSETVNSKSLKSIKNNWKKSKIKRSNTLEDNKNFPRTLENSYKDPPCVDKSKETVELTNRSCNFLRTNNNLSTNPKVLITTSRRPTKSSFKFISEFMEVLNTATFLKRQNLDLKDIIEYGRKVNGSDILVFNENDRKINGLLFFHLPTGPTAFFRLTSVELGSNINKYYRSSNHRPELLFKNFETEIGTSVKNMLASLFHQNPQYHYRKIVTFQNQRDFIFFRHHRYEIFENENTKNKFSLSNQFNAKLKEVGPRFTLKLVRMWQGISTHLNRYYAFTRDLVQEVDRRKNFL